MIKSKFYFKVLTKNIVFLLMLFGVGFFAYNNSFALKMSINYYTVSLSYALIVSTVSLCLLSSYITGRDSEILRYLGKTDFEIFISTIKASFLVILIILTIPLFFILKFLISGVSVDFYLIRELIHFFINFILANIFATVLGAFIGCYVKGFLKYVLSIISLFPLLIGMTDFSKPVVELFNIGFDYVSAPINYSSSMIFNLNYWLDKIFVIIPIILFVLIIYLKDKKCKLWQSPTIVIAGIIIEISIFYFCNNIQLYDKGDIADLSLNNNVIINSYDISMDLTNGLNGNVEIEMKNPTKSDKIEFLLSPLMNIRDIKINNKKVDCLKEGYKITINDSIVKEESLNLQINYQAKLRVDNFYGFPISYTYPKDVCLVDKNIHWIPKFNDDEINYSVHTKSKINLYSNIKEKSNEIKDNIYIKTFENKDTGVMLLGGNMKEIIYKNSHVYLPKVFNDERVINALNCYFKSNNNVIYKDGYDIIVYPQLSGGSFNYENSIMLPSELITGFIGG